MTLKDNGSEKARKVSVFLFLGKCTIQCFLFIYCMSWINRAAGNARKKIFSTEVIF